MGPMCSLRHFSELRFSFLWQKYAIRPNIFHLTLLRATCCWLWDESFDLDSRHITNFANFGLNSPEFTLCENLKIEFLEYSVLLYPNLIWKWSFLNTLFFKIALICPPFFKPELICPPFSKLCWPVSLFFPFKWPDLNHTFSGSEAVQQRPGPDHRWPDGQPAF